MSNDPVAKTVASFYRGANHRVTLDQLRCAIQQVANQPDSVHAYYEETCLTSRGMCFRLGLLGGGLITDGDEDILVSNSDRDDWVFEGSRIWDAYVRTRACVRDMGEPLYECDNSQLI